MSDVLPKLLSFDSNYKKHHELTQFISQYPDEKSCKQELKTIREKEGVVCRRCGSKDHYWKSDKCPFKCKHCKSRTTLRSGTLKTSGFSPILPANGQVS